jgi:predicted HTH transcriptional regulator
MIRAVFANITEADLRALITNEVREGKMIDYKRSLPGSADKDKKEFLADVSSFANTAGGDLIFGVAEVQGVPTDIVGVDVVDLDMELRRLDSIIASGLDPRIRYSMRLVDCANNRRVVVIRCEHSWVGPHRVIFQEHDKLYGRNSAGKYPLDVGELRAAFTLSATTTDRIVGFRTDRIIALSNNDAPIPFVSDPKIVLHCIPIEAFAGSALNLCG